MSGVVADTVTIIWWLSGDARLSEPATQVLQAADDGEGINVSTITLVDVWYALSKRSDPLTLEHLAALDDVLADPQVNVHVLPVTQEVARFAREPHRQDLPDPFDRVILATARAYGLPLVSPDRRLLALSPDIVTW